MRVIKIFIISVLIFLFTIGALSAKTTAADSAAVSKVLKSIYALISQNKLPEALQITQNALQKFGELDELLELKYNLLVEQNHYPQALELVNQQLKKKGNVDHLLAAKFNIHFHNSEWNEALKTAQLKHELARVKSPWDCLNLTRCYIKLNRFPDALNWLEEAVSQGFIHYRILAEPEYQALHKESRLFEIIETIKVAAGMGKPVPHFSASLLTGETFTPARQRGRITLYFFWATWCKPCKAEMANLKALYTELAPKGFDIVAISLDTRDDLIRDYIRQNNLPWKQIHSGKGWQDPIVRQLSVSMAPSLWLTDRRGILRSLDIKGKELADTTKILLDEK